MQVIGAMRAFNNGVIPFITDDVSSPLAHRQSQLEYAYRLSNECTQMPTGGHLDFGNIATDHSADALHLALGQSGVTTPRPTVTTPRSQQATPSSGSSARFIPFPEGSEDSDVLQTVVLTYAREVGWAAKKGLGATKIRHKIIEVFPSLKTHPSDSWVNTFLNDAAAAGRARAANLLSERGETGSVTLDGPKRGDLAHAIQAFEQYICDFDDEKKAKEKLSAKKRRDVVSDAEKEQVEKDALHRGIKRGYVSSGMYKEKTAIKGAKTKKVIRDGVLSTRDVDEDDAEIVVDDDTDDYVVDVSREDFGVEVVGASARGASTGAGKKSKAMRLSTSTPICAEVQSTFEEHAEDPVPVEDELRAAGRADLIDMVRARTGTAPSDPSLVGASSRATRASEWILDSVAPSNLVRDLKAVFALYKVQRNETIFSKAKARILKPLNE